MLNIKYDYKNYVINGFMIWHTKSITPSKSFRVMWIDIIHIRDVLFIWKTYFSLVSKMINFRTTDHISGLKLDQYFRKISKPMQGFVKLYIENPKLKYTSNELLLKITNHIDEGLSNIQEMVDELNKYHNESINFKISDELELSISRFKKSMNRYVVLFSKSIQKPIIQLFTRLIQLIQKIMVSFHIFKYMLNKI